MSDLNLLQIVKPTFDLSLIKERYAKVLSKVHPDNFSTEAEKSAAAAYSSRLSMAYELAKDFPAQAEYFYLQKFRAKPQYVPDSEFLKSVWQYNEAADNNELDIADVQAKYDALLVAITNYFAQSMAEDYARALYELRFYQQLIVRQR